MNKNYEILTVSIQLFIYPNETKDEMMTDEADVI